MRLPIRTTTTLFALASLGCSAFAHERVRLDHENDGGGRPPLHLSPTVTTAPAGYNPTQVRHAYGFDLLKSSSGVVYGGSGQVIALVDAYGSPTIQNDLNVFSKQFGLAATTIKTVYGWTVSGSAPVLSDTGWALETSLDVEWAHAIAPNATLILAVAKSASFTDLVAAVDAAVAAGAKVIAMSWAGAEFSTETTASVEAHFQKSGVTFLASSGDMGSGPLWPAASPSVIAVGGTTLALSSTGALTAPEKGWSGSGGGFSAYFARPAYQNTWNSNANRGIPDVSCIADPTTGVAVYDSTAYNGQTGWFSAGGTSLSTPIWAALVALANEQRALSKTATLTGSTSSLYALAAKLTSSKASMYSTFYFDVTTGSNGGYSATAKFDEVTGLGTPVAPNVATTLGK